MLYLQTGSRYIKTCKFWETCEVSESPLWDIVVWKRQNIADQQFYNDVSFEYFKSGGDGICAITMKSTNSLVTNRKYPEAEDSPVPCASYG